MIDDTKLIAFSPYTSTVYLFEGNKLIHQFNLYSQPILNNFKKKLIRIKEKLKRKRDRNNARRVRRKSCLYSRVFTDFFVDKDSRRSFYLQYYDGDNKRIKIYRFNFDGQLEKIYFLPFGKNGVVPHFKIKKNHLFYAIDREGRIMAYVSLTCMEGRSVL
jgi:hypothetical protein